MRFILFICVWSLLLTLLLAAYVIDQNVSFVNHTPSLVKWTPKKAPIVDFFVRTWVGDGHWIATMLRSIHRFVPSTMYRNIIIAYSAEEHEFFSSYLPKFRTLNIVLNPVTDPKFEVGYNKGGYFAQMYCKFQAYKYSDADYFIHIDSDVIFRQPVTLRNFVRDNKVFVHPVEYKILTTDYWVWKNASENLLRFPVEYETMTRMPLVFPREVYINVEEHIQTVHNKTLVEAMQYCLTFGGVIEFTTLGAFLMKHMPDRWIRAPDVTEDSWVAIQSRSWDGYTPYIAAYYECVLHARSYHECKLLKPPPPDTPQQ